MISYLTLNRIFDGQVYIHYLNNELFSEKATGYDDIIIHIENGLCHNKNGFAVYDNSDEFDLPQYWLYGKHIQCSSIQEFELYKRTLKIKIFE